MFNKRYSNDAFLILNCQTAFKKFAEQYLLYYDYFRFCILLFLSTIAPVPFLIHANL